MRKVDFLICGAQKCGTTALDFYLRQHPLLCFPSKKELHYFDDDAAFAGGSPDYAAYHAWFAPEARHRLLGETTPIYLYKPEVMPRICAYNPDMKLIAVLRHPVDRAYSHWNMFRARGESKVSFREALEHELAIMAAPENNDACLSVSGADGRDRPKIAVGLFPAGHRTTAALAGLGLQRMAGLSRHAIFLLAFAAGAAQAGGGFYPDFRKLSAGLYQQLPEPEACRSGILHDTQPQQVLSTLNAIRSLHGLAPVRYEDSEQSEVMQTALLMAVNGRIDHAPPQHWRC